MVRTPPSRRARPYFSDLIGGLGKENPAFGETSRIPRVARYSEKHYSCHSRAGGNLGEDCQEFSDEIC